MRRRTYSIGAWGLVAAATLFSPAVSARPAMLDDMPASASDAPQDESLPYLQCVPYARQVSGINLYGDALTWWSQAQGRYARGNRPRVGAVMSFAPHGRMELGHVAAVSRVIDSRTVLLRHANWSPIDGRRGQIEDNVRAVDVSPANDWSEVRVWYAPLGDLGTTHWPVNGFIYNRPAPANERLTVLASADTQPARRMLVAKPAAPARIGADFLDGIIPEKPAAPVRKPVRQELAAETPAPKGTLARTALRNDPIGRIIAARMR